MTPSGPVAVTGVTGKLGSRIAAVLAHDGVEQLMVARRPERLPALPGAAPRGPAEYAEREAMARALAGARTLVLVSASLSGRRLAEHTAAVEAAEDAGVERVVYVSLMGAAPAATYLNARDHWQTERMLVARGVPHTVLRPCFYASMLPGLAVDGVVRGSSGDGRVALVSHDDIAEVAAAVVTTTGGAHDGAVLEVTGPASLTLAEAAAEVARATGRPLRVEQETPAEGFAWRARLDATGPQIDGWVSWHLAVARGEVATVSDVVPRLTGRPATTVAEVFRPPG